MGCGQSRCAAQHAYLRQRLGIHHVCRTGLGLPEALRPARPRVAHPSPPKRQGLETMGRYNAIQLVLRFRYGRNYEFYMKTVRECYYNEHPAKMFWRGVRC